MAKSGNREACKILAKQLVQLRKQTNRTYAVSSKVTSMNTQAKVMNSQMKMAGAMSTTAKVSSQALSFISAGSRSECKIFRSESANIPEFKSTKTALLQQEHIYILKENCTFLEM